jgi:hypothetical protein
MQRRFAVLAVALLTVTAGCSALPGTSHPDVNDRPSNDAAQVGDGSGRTVAVGTGGRVLTAPDRAVVRVVVTARADSVETVRERLARNASRMRTALRETGLDADQITSARFDIGRNYEHEERPGAPKFRGQHTFVVTIDDTDRAGEIVVTTVENGAGLDLDGVRTVRTADVSTRPVRQQEVTFATAADAGGSPPSFEGGKVPVTAQVTVVCDATDE